MTEEEALLQVGQLLCPAPSTAETISGRLQVSFAELMTEEEALLQVGQLLCPAPWTAETMSAHLLASFVDLLVSFAPAISWLHSDSWMLFRVASLRCPLKLPFELCIPILSAKSEVVAFWRPRRQLICF